MRWIRAVLVPVFVVNAIALLLFFLVRSRGRSGNDARIPLAVNQTQADESFRCPDCNIILIGLDALRPDHTSLMSYPRRLTPNIEKLSNESLLFTTAYSPASWTLPAFMSVFTGQYPSVHGVLNKYAVSLGSQLVESRLNPAIPTIPQLLKARGYLLAAFTGDAGVSARYGFGRDFDIYLDDRKFGGMDHTMPGAVQWLREHKDRKFFLFLHGYDVHGQYDPPDGYTREFAPAYNGRLKGGKEEQAEIRERGLANIGKEGSGGEPRVFDLSGADVEFYKALYDEKVKKLDGRVGQFVAALSELGLLRKSIVVVVSDHGEEFMDHNNIDHGPSLYEELVRVVFFIRFPGLKGKKIVQEPVSTLDALPTALDAAGVPIDGRLSGRSLLPVLRGERRIDPVFFETDYRLFTHKRGLRTDRYKFIHTLQTGKKELYDLGADPGEQRNIVNSEPRVAQELEQRLLAWMKMVNADSVVAGGGRSEVIKEY